MPITIKHIVQALADLGGQASVQDLHSRVLAIAPAPIPKASRQVVRGRLQDHSSDSKHFRQTGDFFRSVHGLSGRQGIWELTEEGRSSLAAHTVVALGVDAGKPNAGKRKERNPSWSRDELILALDLYLTNPSNPPHKGSPAVGELSALLNKMHRLNGGGATPTLRNENGVYLKMMNLRALDPAFTAVGKVGMQSGGKLEKVVWADYTGRREALAADARAIRQAVQKADETAVLRLPVAEPYEGEEGGIIMRLHKRHERDPKLVREKRKAAAVEGKLACEVCGFDFEAAYGALGAGYIEVHHVKPVHTLLAGAKVKLDDLVLLCANCHRMAHRRKIPVAITDLRALSTSLHIGALPG